MDGFPEFHLFLRRLGYLSVSFSFVIKRMRANYNGSVSFVCLEFLPDLPFRKQADITLSHHQLLSSYKANFCAHGSFFWFIRENRGVLTEPQEWREETERQRTPARARSSGIGRKLCRVHFWRLTAQVRSSGSTATDEVSPTLPSPKYPEEPFFMASTRVSMDANSLQSLSVRTKRNT